MTEYNWNAFNTAIKTHIKTHLSCIDLLEQERPSTSTRQYRAGHAILVRCPHPEHEDKNPSCKVYAQGFKCYACDARGDVFKLISYLDHQPNFRAQIKGGLTRLGLNLDEEKAHFIEAQKAGTCYTPGQASASTYRATYTCTPAVLDEPAPREISDTTREIWERVLAELSLDVEAVRYLEEERKLVKGLCVSVGIKSATLEQWNAALDTVAHDYTREELLSSGIFTKSYDEQGYDSDTIQCHPCLPFMLVIPYRVQGVLQGLRFRQQDTTYYKGATYLSPCGAQNTIQAPYLAHARYGSMFGTRRVLYVHEAELDALSVAQCGRASVGMAGARSWRTSWGESWTDYDVIVLCQDDDRESDSPASQAWVNAIMSDLTELHGEAWVMARVLPVFATLTDASCKDCNALLQKGLLEQHLKTIERELIPAWNPCCSKSEK